MASPKKAQLYVNEAITAGYVITSRAGRHATRIDRRDWREHMAKEHAPWDPEGQGMDWVKCLDQGGHGAADHYRRCYSRDSIIVPQEWVGKMKNSGQGPREYRALPYHGNTATEQKEILVDLLKI
jgi:hypothetical protein